jgi:type II secretory pathway pseudopilin PulG
LNRLRENETIGWKEDSKGITYVELVVAISLLSGVLLIAYSFLSFSYKSLIFTQAKYDATQDARVSLIRLGDNIRKAQHIILDGESKNGVTVSASGLQLDIYVDVDNDGTCELVQYKLSGNKLVMGQAELGSYPTTWYTVIDSVINHRLDTPEPIFTIAESKVNIKLYIKDEYEHLDKPICVETSFTVRSKGAM